MRKYYKVTGGGLVDARKYPTCTCESCGVDMPLYHCKGYVDNASLRANDYDDIVLCHVCMSVY